MKNKKFTAKPNCPVVVGTQFSFSKFKMVRYCALKAYMRKERVSNVVVFIILKDGNFDWMKKEVQ
jgi:hypothetical protein